MFQQHLAIFHKSRPSAMWFLQPWLSATNDFYRNYQELGGGGKMGGQKIILGGAENNLGEAFPPLAPPPWRRHCIWEKGVLPQSKYNIFRPTCQNRHAMVCRELKSRQPTKYINTRISIIPKQCLLYENIET